MIRRITLPQMLHVSRSRRLQVPVPSCRGVASSSSFPPPPPPPPKLGYRSKRDLIIIAVGACGVGGYLFTSNEWDEDVRTAKERLLLAASHHGYWYDNNTLPSSEQDNNDFQNSPPPPIIKQYIESVAKESHSIVIQAQQSGEFYAARQWYPFTDATLLAVASTKTPGFVWNARTTILGLTNHVLEYLVEGKGYITTKVWGKYPMIQVEEDDPYLFFWLAMVPLFPRVLLQSNNGVLIWKLTHDVSSAKAQLCIDKSNDEDYLVEFFFQQKDDHRDNHRVLLRRIQVTSPKMPQPGRCFMRITSQ